MPKKQKIIWIVNCVSRKTTPIADDLSINAYSADLKRRATQWIDRISKPVSEMNTALDLYQGEYWKVVKDTISKNGSLDVELWVVSAGYGLVPAFARIESYDATFTRESSNYVIKDHNFADKLHAEHYWWSKLNEWKGPENGPRSIASLLQKNPNSPVIISLSHRYFSVVSNDLEEALSGVEQKNNLFLVCSGGLSYPFEPFQISTHAKYTQKLGGTRIAVNLRTAAEIISSHSRHDFNFDKVQTMVMKKLYDLPEVKEIKRKKMSDKEIIQIIESMRHKSDSHSSLLRLFREQGYACEQSRFRNLYNKSLKS